MVLFCVFDVILGNDLHQYGMHFQCLGGCVCPRGVPASRYVNTLWSGAIIRRNNCRASDMCWPICRRLVAIEIISIWHFQNRGCDLGWTWNPGARKLQKRTVRKEQLYECMEGRAKSDWNQTFWLYYIIFCYFSLMVMLFIYFVGRAF
jgi:hypothetical protein